MTTILNYSPTILSETVVFASDPTVFAVEWAVLPFGYVPNSETDWVAGSWDTPDPIVFMNIEAGSLPVGIYWTWVTFDTGDEVVVQRVGVLVVENGVPNYMIRPCEPFCLAEELACYDDFSNDPELISECVAIASDIVWLLTARQFGRCYRTVRPVMPCDRRNPINLRDYWPVNEVDEIRIAGEVMDPSGYHIDNWSLLVQTATSANGFNPEPWPLQHFDREVGAAETIEVDLIYGMTPPPLVRRATRRMACELLNWNTSGVCDLPENVTSVARPGIQMEVFNAEDLLNEDGRLGIYEVDLAIKTYNPGRLQAPTTLHSPHTLHRRQTRTG